MPKKIKLNGTVIGDKDVWIYEWLELPFISPSSVNKALEDAGDEDVEIYINSGGGSTWTGSEIYTSIKEYPGFKTVKIPSIAGSAASVFAMAGDKILISPTAQIMIHRSATWTDGNKQRHEQSMQMLTSVDEGMINAYVAKTGRSRDEIRNLMENETFFNAQQAVEWGFADEIMFATEELTPVASANFGTELPPDVLDKIRTTLLTTIKGQCDSPSAQTVLPKANLKEEPKTMDIKELRDKHPELFAQIQTEATNAERLRINALNDLAKAPGAASIVAEAIKSGKSAEAAAIEIVTASARLVEKAGDDRKSDAEASKAAEVLPDDPTKSAEAKKAEEEAQAQAEADEVIAEINRLRGGKQ